MAGGSVQTTSSATSVLAFVRRSTVGVRRELADHSSYLGGTTGNQSGNGIVAGADGYIYTIR